MNIPTTTADKVVTITICDFASVIPLVLIGLVVGIWPGIQAAWAQIASNNWGIEQVLISTVFRAAIGGARRDRCVDIVFHHCFGVGEIESGGLLQELAVGLSFSDW